MKEKNECKWCDGTGYIRQIGYSIENKKCVRCNGTGIAGGGKDG